MIPKVVAIDPGKDAGIAVFCDGKLFRAALTTPDTDEIVASWMGGHVVCEMPQTYKGSRVSIQSLLTLSFRAGKLVGMLHEEQYCLVKPAQWKGQIPKDVHHEQILRQLEVGERLLLDQCLQNIPKSKHHNVYDAVGLGLWYLQRRLKCRSILKDG